MQIRVILFVERVLIYQYFKFDLPDRFSFSPLIACFATWVKTQLRERR